MAPTRSSTTAGKKATKQWWEYLTAGKNKDLHYLLEDVIEVVNTVEKVPHLPSTNLGYWQSLMKGEGKHRRWKAKMVRELLEAMPSDEDDDQNEDTEMVNETASTAVQTDAVVRHPLISKQPTVLAAVENIPEAAATPNSVGAAAGSKGSEFYEFQRIDSIAAAVDKTMEEMQWEEDQQKQAEIYCLRVLETPGLTAPVAANVATAMGFWRDHGQITFPNAQTDLMPGEYDEIVAKGNKKMRRLVKNLLLVRYQEWNKLAVDHEDFYRKWVDEMYRLLWADTASRGGDISDIICCSTCMKGGKGGEAGHETGVCWYLMTLDFNFGQLVERARRVMVRKWPELFSAAKAIDARYILAINWLRLGDGHSGFVGKNAQA